VLCVVERIASVSRETSSYVEVVDMPRKRPALPDVEPSDSESSSSKSEAGEPPASAIQSTGAPVADVVPATTSQNPVSGTGAPADAVCVHQP